MSIRGGTMRWLDRAIERGDALTAWTVAHELPPGRLPLDYALALVVLASNDDADRADRASRRWLQRAARERGDLDLEALAATLDMLPDLVAVTELAAACERHGWPNALVALDHLLPGAEHR